MRATQNNSDLFQGFVKKKFPGKRCFFLTLWMLRLAVKQQVACWSSIGDSCVGDEGWTVRMDVHGCLDTCTIPPKPINHRSTKIKMFTRINPPAASSVISKERHKNGTLLFNVCKRDRLRAAASSHANSPPPTLVQTCVRFWRKKKSFTYVRTYSIYVRTVKYQVKLDIKGTPGKVKW